MGLMHVVPPVLSGNTSAGSPVPGRWCSGLLPGLKLMTAPRESFETAASTLSSAAPVKRGAAKGRAVWVLHEVPCMFGEHFVCFHRAVHTRDVCTFLYLCYMPDF